MPKPCVSCPFEFTEEAEAAHNSGCLPTAGEIVRLKAATGHNWACHSNCNRACQGLALFNESARLGLHMEQGLLVHDFESAHSRTEWRGEPSGSVNYDDVEALVRPFFSRT